MFKKKISESEMTRTDYQFIVVYDKFTKPVANSLKNQARNISIKSTAWSEEQYLHNEANLTNENYVLFLSSKMINENLSNPDLFPSSLIYGVRYKKEGNSLGIYIEDVSYVEAAKKLGDSLKEDWLMEVGTLIVGGLIGSGLFVSLRYYSKQKKAKLYLLYKAVGSFTKTKLMKFVSGELEK